MKQLKDYTETELKALAYDTISELESSQKNLQLINKELQNRQIQSASESEEVVEGEK